MKHLIKPTLNEVCGGSKKEDECNSFKNDLNEALHTAADDIGSGANSLAVKINELLEKYK